MKPEFVFCLENASWPALLVDGTATVRKASSGAKSTFGGNLDAEPTLAGSLWAKENEGTAEQFVARLQRQPTQSTVLKLRMKDGTVSAFQTWISRIDTATGPHFILQFFKDPQGDGTTESLASAQKQKLECALQLTRTVALDFNNALTSILGHASLLLGKLETAHPWRTSLVEIEKSAEKAAEIAHDLAAFSRQDKDAKSQQAGNLNELVRRTVDLFRSNGQEITWDVQFEDRLYTVNFDEAKMQQAFVKILENASQALNGFGRVTLATRNQEFADNFQDGSIKLAPGNYVCVEFADSGPGIAADVLPRIFEPFFTTKNNPNHRGLGLAWVYGIVTNHGGSVAVASEVGKGTSVRVYLPAQKKVVKDRSHKVDDFTGHQTVLMIDDEDLLLTMGETVLSSYGYRVLTANNGQKALDLFYRCSSEIDLVITDLVMPQMSGREVIERLRQHTPDVKIICASGFIRTGADDEDHYLQKPFTSQDLLRKVKQATSGN
jgi:two-component system cell cycle sensor histidine kinase/response regulator CckA